MRSIAPLLLLSGFAAWLPAQDAPSYTKDIKPFLQKYCLECHNGKKGKGEFDVTSHAAVKKGGISFPGFIPGDPKESFMLQLVEGRAGPAMPPKKSPQPTAAEKKKLRDWIAAGAKDDGDKKGASRTLPDLPPRARLAGAVAALAYSPDGKLLAAGVHKDAMLFDAGGKAIRALAGDLPITAITFSPDSQRLAIARGSSGTAGVIDIVAIPQRADAPGSPRSIAAHADAIYSIVFSPDGKRLATAGYDRLIKLWDAASGEEVGVLKDHSDTIYGLAFSPDGKLLASAAADRAVKVWDVASGKRLYTLGDATDWLYALAWSPDGKHVAAGGVDRSIRVWTVNASEGKLVHSVFAHEGPVLRLVYSPDGLTLYSLSEDRGIKAWGSARMVERHVYDKQPETPLSLAVRPDGKALAVGRFDGVLLLLDPATGKVMNQLLPAQADGAGQRPGEPLRPFPVGWAESSRPTTPLQSILSNRWASKTRPTLPDVGFVFLAEEKAKDSSLAEQEPNNSAATGQVIQLNPTVTIAGTLDRAGDVDYYRFEAQAGQQIGVQLTPGDKAKLDPVLELVDESGRVLAESGTGVLGHVCEKAGRHAISIRDRDYRGGGLSYQLKVGEVPVVTAIFPLGLRRGSEGEVRIEGVHLGIQAMKAAVPGNAAVGSRIPIKIEALGSPAIVVGEFTEVAEPAAKVLASPVTINGRIEAPGDVDVYSFRASKGQPLIVEVQARRIGSPLDSAIEITDAAGKPVPRAVLRSVALTYSTFRDHDSQTSGIRIETWNELAINDYLWVGQQLLRIRALPKNPDDDCQFFAAAGQRLGYLGSTPQHVSQGTPMYKVQIHPPGSTFPPNGFPVVPLDYRNDDGGPGYGKDSMLAFDPPADGVYQVKIGDSRGMGGSAYGYRLTVRPPRPDFKVSFSPTAPAVWLGGAVPVNVTAERIDGFDDAIELRLENLPKGLNAPATSIPAGETTTAFALFAEADAEPIDKAPNLKLIARARIAGQDVLREAAGSQPKVVPPGDIVTRTAQSEIAVKPGEIVRLTVQIERKMGFAGRVPLDVRGLPHGVRVLDIGLNGILITEKESSRTIRIYCEPWVEPTEHPIVVLARREGKNTEHAARSVLLKVVK